MSSTSGYLDPKVWGPHYWFFLHTVAMTYPHHPNSVTKKNTMSLFKTFLYLFRLSKYQENLVK